MLMKIYIFDMIDRNLLKTLCLDTFQIIVTILKLSKINVIFLKVIMYYFVFIYCEIEINFDSSHHHSKHTINKYLNP